MRKALMLCLCGAFLFGMASLAAAEEYNLYDYRPMELQMRWVYTLYSSQAKGEVTVDSEVIGEEEYEGVAVKRVRWPSGWADLYEQSEEGLKRHKDIYGKNERYATYEPPAIQYPKTMKVGEVYERTSVYKHYEGTGDSPVASGLEALQFRLLGVEDITVPAGTFKGCLKTLADYRLFNKQYMETRRKIVLEWSAPGVGLAKAVTVHIMSGSAVWVETTELKEFFKLEPAAETQE